MSQKKSTVAFVECWEASASVSEVRRRLKKMTGKTMKNKYILLEAHRLRYVGVKIKSMDGVSSKVKAVSS